jgi:hypothetical protein
MPPVLIVLVAEAVCSAFNRMIKVAIEAPALLTCQRNVIGYSERYNSRLISDWVREHR